MPHSPTPEQQAILDAIRDTKSSIMVTAYAGCAKTTTLEMIGQALPKNIPGMALAFNVKIKKELEKRLPSTITVKTLNGLGHSAWGQAIGKRCEVKDNKRNLLMKEVLAGEGFQATMDQWGAIRDLVTEAMQVGLVPSIFNKKGLVDDTPEIWKEIAKNAYLPDDEILLDFARKVLIQSIKQGMGGVIDFDDQIYLSAMLGGVFPRSPMLLVDEAQDLSPLNHIQIRKSAAGRLVVVGDPKQAIYAFRGADSASMGKIRTLREDWIDLPLATTFRCPKIIVERQQSHAPGFRAAPGNAQGQVLDWTGRKLAEDGSGGWSFPEDSSLVVLCRANAPLLSLAFKLIKKGVSVQMLGRDIGKNLGALAKKILKDDDVNMLHAIAHIQSWKTREVNLALANSEDGKVSGIVDRAECLIAVAESLPENAKRKEMLSCLQDLFSHTSGKVTLASGHRSKGLEWDTVVHLDPFRIPSKWAMDAAKKGDTSQLDQETNLNYVIETRAKKTLILANLKGLLL